MQKVLIVEDEPDVADLVEFNLSRAGYKTAIAHDGVDGLQIAFSIRPDIVLLDLMLPKKDGFAVFKELKRDGRTRDTPVIFLTARSQVEDRIRGLEAGADDYLTKPFSPKELLLRVKLALCGTTHRAGATEVEHGPFRFDKNTFRFYLQNEPVELTSTEFKLFLRLVERAGSTQGRVDLLRSVWEYSDACNSRTLDTHIKRLRQKLGVHAQKLETVRGLGYRVRSLDE